MILGENNEKMSKSKGNVVNPDDIVERYGADTLRMYEMSAWDRWMHHRHGARAASKAAVSSWIAFGAYF